MVEYRSTVRVYELDESGEPFALLYAEGDVIPEDEARRQGLVDEPAAVKKRSPATKARKIPENKNRNPEG